jgi:3-oxoacyl-[acyl-carrier protein] reductase
MTGAADDIWNTVDLMIKGRSALVLGSTSGLGLAVANGLAGEGARTAFTGRRGEAARSAAAAHPGALGLELDVADPESVRRGIAEVTAAFGPIDILVLNSGGPPPGTAADLTPAELEASLRTLLLAQIDLVSLVLPGMRDRKWGRIVAIGSSGVDQPIPGLARSNAARAALAGYLKTLAGEVAADGITVNMVLPGRIATRRITEIDNARAKATGLEVAEVQAQALSAIPAGRYGTAEEFASMAVFLCSDNASYVTGTRVRVDGGMVGAH